MRSSGTRLLRPRTLTRSQLAIVDAPLVPGTLLIVDAGPGSGKTSVLAHLAHAKHEAGVRVKFLNTVNATSAALAAQLETPDDMVRTFASAACTMSNRARVVPLSGASGLDISTVYNESMREALTFIPLKETKPKMEKEWGVSATRAASKYGSTVANSIVGPPLTYSYLYFWAEWMQWYRTAYPRSTRARVDWKTFVAERLAPLHVFGEPSDVLEEVWTSADACADAMTQVFDAVEAKGLSRLTPSTLAAAWAVVTAVRQNVYLPLARNDSMHVSTYSILEASWLPERFNWRLPDVTGDIVIADEAADLYGAHLTMLHHYAVYGGAMVVLAGDPNQHIYDFDGALNAMRDAEGLLGLPTTHMPMYTSFRVPKSVAEFIRRTTRGKKVEVLPDAPAGSIVVTDSIINYDADVLDALVLFRSNYSLLLGLIITRQTHPDTSMHVSEEFYGKLKDWMRAPEPTTIFPDEERRMIMSDAAVSIKRQFSAALSKLDGDQQTILHAFEEWLIPAPRGAIVAPFFSTVHSAKGAEYHNVILENGIIEDASSVNVIYVACTRTSDRLVIVDKIGASVVSASKRVRRK